MIDPPSQATSRPRSGDRPDRPAQPHEMGVATSAYGSGLIASACLAVAVVIVVLELVTALT